MDNKDYLPTNCGESRNVGGVYICKLAVAPCPLYHGKYAICEKEKMQGFLEAMKNLVGGVKENVDNG